MARSRTDGTRLPPMGQGLAVVAVLIGALLFTLLGVGGYLMAMRVAAARAEMSRIDGLTQARQADIRTLQRDYEIRSRLPELDRWRGPLALAPAGADQFVDDSGDLAAAARARGQALRAVDEAARAPASSYTNASRGRLDRLIDSIAG